MADDKPVEEPVVTPPVEEPEKPAEGTPPEKPEVKEGLTEEEQDALLAVNGDVKGELKPNRPLDEEVPTEEEPEAPAEEEEKPAEEEAPAEEKAPEVTPEADETGVYTPPTATDPGEFKPGDYSFEVTTTDGKTHKITSVDEADTMLQDIDKNPEIISAYQFGLLSRKSSVMEQSVAADRKVFEQDKAKFDEQQTQAETREQQMVQWQGEVNYLRQKGDLPTITDELNNADWTKPEIASQTGVKETLALFKYVEEENERRMAAGLQPDLSFVSGMTAMKLEAMQKAEQDNNAEDKSLTRARGSMVGKKAPYSPTEPQKKGTLVGPAQGLEDLATQAYYAET